MPRYVAFLRGVSPMNCKMPALKQAFERAGFSEVQTLLSSGNVVFTARARSAASVERAAEDATGEHLGRRFDTLVRSVDELRTLIASDPFASFKLAPGSKRVVTFLREPPAQALETPLVMDNARILLVRGREALSVYVPDPKKGPVFMTLLEKTFGKQITTRTWDTVQKATRKEG